MKAALKRKYTKPARVVLAQCYNNPDCTIDYGDNRQLPSRTSKTHFITPYERDVYFEYKDGTRMYVYTHKHYTKSQLMLHVGGPLDGQRLSEPVMDNSPLAAKYATYNISSRWGTKGAPRVLRVYVAELS